MPWDAAQLVVRACRRQRARDRRRAGRVRRPADVGRRTSRCGSSATAPTSGRCTASGRTSEPELVVDVGGDIAGPQWVFGQSRFALLVDGRVAFAYGRDGADRLAVLRGRRQRRASSTCPYGVLPVRHARRATRWSAWPAARRSEPVVLRVDVDGGEPRGAASRPRPGARPGLVLAARARDLPHRAAGTGIGEAHALVYPPTNPDASAPDGDLPPLMVVVHGGPTANARRRCSTWRCSTGPRAASASPTSTTAAPPATAGGTATRCRAAGASSTSTTSSPAPATSPTQAGSTRPAWRSAAGRPAGTRRWPR